MNVVIVEDNEHIANWLGAAVGLTEGIDVRVVTSNFHKLIGNGQWDKVHAVLCDWSIPHFDTAKFLEYLSNEKRHVRRVVFTAYPLDNVRSDLADQVLQKPATLEEILDAIHFPLNRGDGFNF